MSPRRSSQRRRQVPKDHSLQSAKDRGIFAVRRAIDPASHPLFEAIAENLGPEVRNASRIFDVSTLGVTIVGFTRFNKRHRFKGPSTPEIIKKVPSAKGPLEIEIGELGVFGSGQKHKLGFSLVSKKLDGEVEAFEEAFGESGFALARDPNNPSGEANPHCSVGLLYEDHLGYFEDERTLFHLTAVALEVIADDASVLLRPVDDEQP